GGLGPRVGRAGLDVRLGAVRRRVGGEPGHADVRGVGAAEGAAEEVRVHGGGGRGRGPPAGGPRRQGGTRTLTPLPPRERARGGGRLFLFTFRGRSQAPGAGPFAATAKRKQDATPRKEQHPCNWA